MEHRRGRFVTYLRIAGGLALVGLGINRMLGGGGWLSRMLTTAAALSLPGLRDAATTAALGLSPGPRKVRRSLRRWQEDRG